MALKKHKSKVRRNKWIDYSAGLAHCSFFMVKKHKILTGMTVGALATVALIFSGPVFNLLPFQAQTMADRASIWAIASSITLVSLAVSIGRLARHRFVEPRDMEPVSRKQTPRALTLSQQLQNTLEQAVLAIGVYSVWTALTPASWGIMPIAGAMLFSVGRLLFFLGYSKGAGERALGFALTFYPSLAMLGCSIFAVFVSGSA